MIILYVKAVSGISLLVELITLMSHCHKVRHE